ncbi:putative AAA-ATPase [Halanaerobium saccharolyticum]|uniref:Putative AAA-ATPase n=1 Tax=Halanaerobium saccharolyticum TaxID=43595 RepID=A0A4R7Z4F2_9FIRM|nr:putative AAA-ATPase [Halanaerobium saccharolyticum]TDW05395.1 putative AAA-ATPase [Halanaerobium saccharolyticum]TDX62910.1 putative AAA-ATPase [Halanaerobium saccharolyticum]
MLESYGEKYIFFLRPRRFGKTLFLSTLENYYDLNKKEELLYTFLVKVQKAIEIFINKYNLNLKCPESHDPASMLNLY